MQPTLISRVKKKISPKTRREYNQKITVAEIEKAIKSFESNKSVESNKSAGNDALLAEIYKTFHEILKKDLHKLYIEIYQLGEMPREMRQTVMSCLHKKGDREDITNWRPTSRLNYDNKIYTKILVIKIQSTLEDIIGPKLTPDIKGRTIIETLQLNQDVMSYANANKIQAVLGQKKKKNI